MWPSVEMFAHSWVVVQQLIQQSSETQQRKKAPMEMVFLGPKKRTKIDQKIPMVKTFLLHSKHINRSANLKSSVAIYCIS